MIYNEINKFYDFLTFWVYREILNSNSVAIDVGANQGNHSRVLSNLIAGEGKRKRLFGPKISLYLFEPIPFLFHDLQDAFESNANVKVCNSAVSDSNGSTTFYINKSNFSLYSGLKNGDEISGGKSVPIEANTIKLDSFSSGIKRLDLIKVDVEGAELFALRGANDLIRKHKPVIIFEWGDQSSPIYGTTSADIWSFWNDREYQLFTVTGEDCSEFGSFIESSKLQTIWNYIAIPNSSIQNFRPMLKRLAELTKAFIVGAKNPEYNVRINTGNVVLTSVYDTVTIKGQISNHSDIAWIGEHQEWLGPRVEPRQFANSYKLGIRWQDENGNYVSEDRRPLPADVLFPGESKEFIIKLHPYTVAGFLDEGKYQLMIDVIKENEFWLCDHSQETAGKGPATIQAEIGFKSR